MSQNYSLHFFLKKPKPYKEGEKAIYILVRRQSRYQNRSYYLLCFAVSFTIAPAKSLSMIAINRLYPLCHNQFNPEHGAKNLIALEL